MGKEDLSEEECEWDLHTNKTDEAHDPNLTENGKEILETNFPGPSAIHLLLQSTKVANISCDGHIYHF